MLEVYYGMKVLRHKILHSISRIYTQLFPTCIICDYLLIDENLIMPDCRCMDPCSFNVILILNIREILRS